MDTKYLRKVWHQFDDDPKGTVRLKVGDVKLGKSLFYSGLVNVVSGPYKGGKHCLILLTCLQELRKGEKVVYLDFERTGDLPIIDPLIGMGASEDDFKRFEHISLKNKKLTVKEKDDLINKIDEIGPSLVVFDSASASMSLDGVNGYSVSSTLGWYMSFPKVIASCGPCVLLVDHTTGDIGGGIPPTGPALDLSNTRNCYMVDGSLEVFEDDYELSLSKGCFSKAVLDIVCTRDNEGNHAQDEKVARLLTWQWRDYSIESVLVDYEESEKIL